MLLPLLLGSFSQEESNGSRDARRIYGGLEIAAFRHGDPGTLEDRPCTVERGVKEIVR